VLVLLCSTHSVGRDAAAPARSGRGGAGKPAGRPGFGLLRPQGLRGSGGGGGGGDSSTCSDGGSNSMAPGWSSPASPIGKRAHSPQRQAGRGEAKLVVGKHYAYVRRSGKAETVFTLVH
jgi:hypothetical protein